MEEDGVGEAEANYCFGGDLDLLASGDPVGSSAYSSAGCGADGCTFASAEDAAEDGSYGCSAADFFCGVLAASFAFFGEGIGGDLDAISVAIDGGEGEGKQGAAFEVGGILGFIDVAGDGRSLGSTTRPSTTMSDAMAPVNRSPVWVVALSSAWVMRTGMEEPAGRVMLRTTGSGGGGGWSCACCCGCGWGCG